MKKLLLAAASIIAFAAPASAARIVYTLSGTFSGTRAGAGPFTVDAVFTGIGNTANTSTAFGFSQILAVPLSSLTALTGGVTFTITQPSFFYLYDSTVLSTQADRLGLSFDNTGFNALGLESTAFDGYDGLSDFPTTSAPTYFQNAAFSTDKGFVTINGFSNGSFGADVVPEPATWGMMALGFGLVGFSARRRRIAAAAA